MSIAQSSLHSVNRHLHSKSCIITPVTSTIGIRGFASKKKKNVTAAKGTSNHKFDIMLRMIKGVYPESEPFTEEEKAYHHEVAKKYNRMTSIEHNHWTKDLQNKIDWQWKAINALPVELQDEAMEPDYEPYPEGRFIPTWTPPIPGFSRAMDEEE